MDENPAIVPFPINEVPNIIRKFKAHEAFIKMSSTMVETVKPAHLKDQTKWEDWRPTFENFMRASPGRSGIPLLYVIREITSTEPH